MLHRILIFMALLGVMAFRGLAEAQTDTLELKPKRSAVGRFLNYFESANKRVVTDKLDFNFIGGPHYSSDTKLGLGVVAAGLYRCCKEDSLCPVSNISLTADFSTAGFYLAGISGTHVFPKDKRRINYNLYLYYFKTYFWGIGFKQGIDDANKTRYKDFRIQVDADYIWRVAPGLFIGPMAGFDFVKGSGMSDNKLWLGEPEITRSFCAGMRLMFDTRDHLTNPYNGWFLELQQKAYPRFLGNGNYNFSSTQFHANFYKQVWKGGVIASRIQTLLTYGSTPWGMLAKIGGNTLRGYYEGRYRDKGEADLVVELRQKVYRRSGAVLWAGVGSVFSRLSQIQMRHLLPNFGIGYRWEFKQRTNVRIDFGFGRGESGLIFNINEAF